MNEIKQIEEAMQNCARAFQRAKSADHARMPSWMDRWNFQGDYGSYHSSQDLIRWLEWFQPEDCAKHYLPEEQVASLTDKSERVSRRILAPFLPDGYRFRHVDEFNAVDFRLQTLYPVPERMHPARVLDFGAGFGRQMNLWCDVPGLVYVAIEAMELAYVLQSFYLGNFGTVNDYLLDGKTTLDAPGIYHLPSWRMDMLPNAYFDLVICTMVLQEIPGQMVRSAIETFRRCVKPGGAVYIRDHGLATQGMHNLNVDTLLAENGFILEFRPYVMDNSWRCRGGSLSSDIHGVPRIFRRTDSRYPVYVPEKARLAEETRRLLAEIDTQCGGLLHRMVARQRRRKIRTDRL